MIFWLLAVDDVSMHVVAMLSVFVILLLLCSACYFVVAVHMM